MEMSFMAACMQYFGVREGQTKLQFGQEVKALTPQDRADMIPGLEKNLSAINGEPVTVKA